MRVADLRPGLELGPSAWREVSQERIDAFAAATDDPQWIHVDPVRAADGPFGTTVAHGYLTLALLVPFASELLPVEDAALTVNYGLNRVRFPAAVPSGSRIRARVRVEAVADVAGGTQVTLGAT
ncbi:MAG: MaoC family dehydratase, partial [Pseudomonadota bacterium]